MQFWSIYWLLPGYLLFKFFISKISAKGSVFYMSGKYDHSKVEAKWQEVWFMKNPYHVDLSKDDSKFYNLMMFPYPSAEGLHAGNMFAFTGSDVYGRFQRMHGKNVFEPIGLDGFGIHSENYALKVGKSPKQHAQTSEQNYYKQLRMIGNSFDWGRTIETYDPDYYRWTQWIFVQMFKAGLAYKKKSYVNWCPGCKTVLADEQIMTPAQAGKLPPGFDNLEDVPEGIRVCERCGNIPVRKELEQWFFRITNYADRLLSNLDKIDWTEKVKIAQKDWIGKSKGLAIDFKIKGMNLKVSVWTKFWETVFGTTFLTLAPEHPIIKELEIPEANKKEVQKYIKESLNKTEQQRKEEAGEKSGVFTGLYAVNPANGQEVPVWISNYVLWGVGSGAVMGVPAHDERDYAFGRKYDLAVRQVVDVQVETHSIVIKKSVDNEFIEAIQRNGWYLVDYEGWGYGVTVPKGSETEYIEIVQSYLKDGPWYVHTDGVLKAVIFKNKVFTIPQENGEAKIYGRKLNIPEGQLDWDNPDGYMFCHEKGGLLVNSNQFNGLDAWGEGKDKMAEWLIDGGSAEWSINYHLRDWLVSRQRYWGPPIPMVYCGKCAKTGKSWFTENEPVIQKDYTDWDSVGWYPEENLPVELPDISDYKPEGAGKGPLANHPEFYETKCPSCGADATRETDVSDTFVDSSWYFLRYPTVDAKNASSVVFDTDITSRWLPVDQYFGGAEHSVLHLMYARFVTQVLFDLKYLNFEEPFPKFFAHGLMIKDGAKMSKSRGNVVNPDEYIKKYGADTLRLYLMFMGPMDGSPDFRDTGIEGMHRFVKRVWSLFSDSMDLEINDPSDIATFQIKMHQTIKKVSADISNFHYNTAIASIMEFVNVMKNIAKKGKENSKSTREWKDALQNLAKILAPFAPHMTEEVWEMMGEKSSIHFSKWPSYDEKFLVVDEVTVVIQVNGKVRGQVTVDKGIASNKEKMISVARKDSNVEKWIKDRKILKEIFVPEKLINFVTA